MSVPALASDHPTETTYVASKKLSSIRHEYLGGDVYATAGASEAHNRIAANLTGILRNQLRGRYCEAFGTGHEGPPAPAES